MQTAHLNGQNDAVKQKRLLNRLVRDLVAFTGTAMTDIASRPRKARDPNKPRRVLYRRDLSDADLDRVIIEIGPERIAAGLDRYTAPFSLAAE